MIDPARSSSSVRAPAVAGMFYPGSAPELGALVDRLLAEARTDVARPSVCPKAIVAPHAGYVFSGKGAARAFSLLEPFAAEIARVVIVGPAHRVRVSGLVEPDDEQLATPLGVIDVDRDAL